MAKNVGKSSLDANLEFCENFVKKYSKTKKLEHFQKKKKKIQKNGQKRESKQFPSFLSDFIEKYSKTKKLEHFY